MSSSILCININDIKEKYPLLYKTPRMKSLIKTARSLNIKNIFLKDNTLFPEKEIIKSVDLQYRKILIRTKIMQISNTIIVNLDKNIIEYSKNCSNEDYFQLITYFLQEKLCTGIINEVLSIDWCKKAIQNDWNPAYPYLIHEKIYGIPGKDSILMPLDVFILKEEDTFESLNPNDKANYSDLESEEEIKKYFSNRGENSHA